MVMKAGRIRVQLEQPKPEVQTTEGIVPLDPRIPIELADERVVGRWER